MGRGAQVLLPRERGLAVRVIAPLEQRIARATERHGLDRKSAIARLRATDEGRVFLVRRHFHADVADVRLYDLVLNLERLDLEAAAAVIAAAFHRRFPAEPGVRIGEEHAL